MVPADPPVFRGTMVARVSAFETQPDSVHRFKGDARVSCDAGACSVFIPGSPWLLAGATISAGDGSPGTYRTSHPAAGKAARCASFRIQDAFESTLTISAHKLTYRATAPGWPMTQCTSSRSVGRAPGTWTFTGTLVE